MDPIVITTSAWRRRIMRRLIQLGRPIPPGAPAWEVYALPLCEPAVLVGSQAEAALWSALLNSLTGLTHVYEPVRFVEGEGPLDITPTTTPTYETRHGAHPA